MDFSFLKNTELTPIEVPAKKVGNNGRVAQERNPTNGASLRLFKDGSVYPSQEVADKYNLEYTKDKSGNGFDIFSSNDWSQYPKDAQPVMFISATAKSNPRVDLFGSAREVNGELTSVMTQGSKTFGVELIKMIESTYNTTLFTEQKYVDLQIIEDISMPGSLNGVSYIPKTVNKGEHVGMLTTERRDNAVINPLAIYINNNEPSVEESVEVEENEPQLA